MDEEEQESSQIRTSPYGSPMYNYGSGIVSLTDPKAAIRKMEDALQCIVRDADGKEVSMGQPLLNKEGRRSVIGLAESIVNQITIMGNINKDEKMKFGMNQMDTCIKMLMVSRKRWEIRDAHITRSMINTYMCNVIFITMNRGLEEGERRFWKGSTQEITQRVETQQKKKGMFDMFRRN